MNSRWFLVQVTTSKRVIMENEREKVLREELKKIQDSKPKGDSLLKLIRSLQRLQASGPPASSVRLPSAERAEVARAVEKYLMTTGSNSSSKVITTASSTLIVAGSRWVVHAVEQEGLRRCSVCCAVFVTNALLVDHWRAHSHTGSEPVYILRPHHCEH